MTYMARKRLQEWAGWLTVIVVAVCLFVFVMVPVINARTERDDLKRRDACMTAVRSPKWVMRGCGLQTCFHCVTPEGTLVAAFDPTTEANQ